MRLLINRTAAASANSEHGVVELSLTLLRGISTIPYSIDKVSCLLIWMKHLLIVNRESVTSGENGKPQDSCEVYRRICHRSLYYVREGRHSEHGIEQSKSCRDSQQAGRTGVSAPLWRKEISDGAVQRSSRGSILMAINILMKLVTNEKFYDVSTVI